MIKLNSRSLVELFLIFVLLLTVGYLQYFLLVLILQYGFTPDDWKLLFFFKTLGSDPFSKISYVWSVKGAYTTSQVYFIGILNIFFGFHYPAYQIFNVLIKIIATVSIYPFILVIFKRRLLAFITTILYAVSFMGSRSLEYVVKGTDYLAIIPMNIFFIIYYFIVVGTAKQWWWFALMTFLWFLSLMISPIRIYPILVLIPIFEFLLLVHNKKTSNLLKSFKRLSILYIPLILIYLYKPNAVLNFLQGPHILFQAILRGNLHIILTPFQGLGLTLFFSDVWNWIFSTVEVSTFRDYVLFLFNIPKGPIFILGTFSLFLSLIIFKRKLYSFFVIISTSLLLDLLIYFIIIISLRVPAVLRFSFDLNKVYPVLISGFMLGVSLASFLEWKFLKSKNDLLLALWIAPPAALIYIFLIWLLAPFGVGFENRQGYYLVIPAMTASLFTSAVLVLIYEKAIHQKNFLLKLVLFCLIFVSLLSLLISNKNNINYYFGKAREDGRFIQDQEEINDRLLSAVKNINYKVNNFIYFSIEDTARSNYFYEQSLFESLPSRVLFKKNKIEEGCITTFYQGIDKLNNIAVIYDGVKGFFYGGLCGKSIKGNDKKIFYSLDNFYAFKIKNGEIIDIKQETLDQLTFLLRLSK